MAISSRCAARNLSSFSIVADQDGSVARKYGIIAGELSAMETVRNLFIIDDKQVIRAILIYPLTNGRNIPEILRMVNVLQTTDKEKVVTPTSWIPGCPVLVL